jgi:hypothetical protein
MKRRIKCKVVRLKNDALLLLFGIKPRRNRLKFNKIKVEERSFSTEEFNKWSRNTLNNTKNK